MTRGEGASAIPASAATGGSAGESATTPAGIDVGAGNKTSMLGVATASTASPGVMAAPTGGQPGRLAPGQPVPPGHPAGGCLVRRPANRHGAPQHRLQRSASS
jgi:hypothetical protein